MANGCADGAVGRQHAPVCAPSSVDDLEQLREWVVTNEGADDVPAEPMPIHDDTFRVLCAASADTAAGEPLELSPSLQERIQLMAQDLAHATQGLPAHAASTRRTPVSNLLARRQPRRSRGRERRSQPCRRTTRHGGSRGSPGDDSDSSEPGEGRPRPEKHASRVWPRSSSVAAWGVANGQRDVGSSLTRPTGWLLAGGGR